jgi:hypothetical protein
MVLVYELEIVKLIYKDQTSFLIYSIFHALTQELRHQLLVDSFAWSRIADI